MPYLVVLLGLFALIAMTTWGKLNAFLAFIVVTVFVGICFRLSAAAIAGALQKGIGEAMGSLAVIVCVGAMLGNLIARTGAAERIAETLVKAFGVRYIQWALVCTGFVVGTTMFYGIGFFLLVPLIFSVVYRYGLPAVYIGLPTLAALSVMHGYLPPHPAPTALAALLGASIGTTLRYGLVIAIPAILVAGPLFSLTTKHMKVALRREPRPADREPGVMPGRFVSFAIALLPVFLLLVLTPLTTVGILPNALTSAVELLSVPSITLLISLAAGTYFLGLRAGHDIRTIMRWYEAAIRDVSMILLIIGGAGAFKQVLMEAGVDKLIAAQLGHLSMPPLIMGWLIAAVLRIAIGSSTIAGLMAAGIMLPLMRASHINPNLMVLSIGAGSMICSHVNDSGFWLFKEYFGLSLRQTFLSFTIMESLVAIMGLLGVLALSQFVS